MSKRKSYSYADAPRSGHGLMRCYVCGKPITQGRYRYHETNDAYVTAHEACCADDPKWAEFDRRAAEHEAYRRERSAACREFQAKWGMDELDHYILEEPTHDH